MRCKIIFSFFLLMAFGQSYGVIGDLAEEGKDLLLEKGKGKFVQYSKNGVRSVIDKLPGGKFVTGLIFDSGESMEDRVERIDKNQKTSLAKIREISSKVLSSKRKIEEMWRYKAWAIGQGNTLAERLRNSKPRKLLGAAFENWLQIPINPAEYIPNVPYTQKLKTSLDYDLSFEEGTYKDARHLLSNTRSALLAANLGNTNPQAFKRKYQEAEDYDISLMQAMQAKEVTLIRIYKAEVEQLTSQIKTLEEKQTQKGLTIGEVMQIEMVIDNKRKQIRELNEKIDQAIKQATVLTHEQRIEVAARKAKENIDGLDKWMADERKRMQNRRKK
ncbi:MAG: hypothetical protein ACYC2U_00270 [Candidatus Amoebophilus sp.]